MLCLICNDLYLSIVIAFPLFDLLMHLSLVDLLSFCRGASTHSPVVTKGRHGLESRSKKATHFGWHMEVHWRGFTETQESRGFRFQDPAAPRIMEEGFVECTLFYCFYEKMAYVNETLMSHLANFTSVSQLVSQNENVHTRWGWEK